MKIMNPKLHKKLERIGEKLGYKKVRHLLGYRLLCFLNRKKINQVMSMLMDDESRMIVKTYMKARGRRNYEKYMPTVYDASKEIREIDIFGNPLCYHPNHYFEPKLIHLSSNEVFIDAGGYIGDTSLNFIKKIGERGGQYKKIHIFEVIKTNYEKIAANLKANNVDISTVNCHHVGLSSKEEYVYFENALAGSRASKYGTEKVHLVALDEYFSQEEKDEITFVKMDIEGSEMEALKGMQNIIKKNKPKLAISIYHRSTDLWKVPLYIKQLNPDYKLYIRQYHIMFETVCYAIPQ